MGNHANLAHEADEGLTLLPLQFLRLVLSFQLQIIGRTEHGIFALAIKAWCSGNVRRKLAVRHSALDDGWR